MPVLLGPDSITLRNPSMKSLSFPGKSSMPFLVFLSMTTPPSSSLNSGGIHMRPFESTLTITSSNFPPYKSGIKLQSKFMNTGSPSIKVNGPLAEWSFRMETEIRSKPDS
jgi:hypothetical protein